MNAFLLVLLLPTLACFDAQFEAVNQSSDAALAQLRSVCQVAQPGQECDGECQTHRQQLSDWCQAEYQIIEDHRTVELDRLTQRRRAFGNVGAHPSHQPVCTASCDDLTCHTDCQ